MYKFRVADGNPHEYEGLFRAAYARGYDDARGKRRRIPVVFSTLSFRYGPFYLQGFRDGITPVLAMQPELNDDNSIRFFQKIGIII